MSLDPRDPTDDEDTVPVPTHPGPDATTGDDVLVNGEPWVVGPLEEITRRRVALTIVIVNGCLVLAALAFVRAGLDVAAAVAMLGPSGAVVWAVVHHYFGRKAN